MVWDITMRLKRRSFEEELSETRRVINDMLTVGIGPELDICDVEKATVDCDG